MAGPHVAHAVKTRYALLWGWTAAEVGAFMINARLLRVEPYSA